MASLSSKRKTSVNRRLKQRDVHVKAAPMSVSAIGAFDERVYTQLKTRFDSAIAKSCDSDADVRMVMRALVQQEFDNGGRAAALQMQPYIVKYVGDYRDQYLKAAPSLS